MKLPPLSPGAISMPRELIASLKGLIGQEFELTGKSRTDGSRLRRLVQETLSRGPLPPEAPVETYRIIPPRRKGVPRILREFLDTYIVTSGDSYNLQVWNRNPAARSVQVEYLTGERLLACDVRFVLCRVHPKREEIRTLLILTPQYIESHFGPFGKPTIKQQLLISAARRAEISRNRDRLFFRPDAASMKTHICNRCDVGVASIHDPPDQVASLRVLREIVIKNIIGKRIPPGPTKNRGQHLEAMVAGALGYRVTTGELLAGGYPDLRHQAMEVKVQDAATVDLGRFSPQFEEPVPSCEGFTTHTIRYLIALTNPSTGLCEGAALCPGASLGELFTYISDKSFKCQRSIPMSFFEKFDGQCLFNPD